MNKKSIEEYRAEVESRPFETHNAYRNKTGRQKRHTMLMAAKPKHWERDEEKKVYKKACEAMEKKIALEVREIREQQSDAFRQKQYMYDFQRGAYGKYRTVEEIPPWITDVYFSLHGDEEE